MKSFVPSLLVFLIYHNCLSQADASSSIQQLDWLVGTWERLNDRPERSSFEVWQMEGHGLKGIGFTLQGADTVFREDLEIVSQEGKLYYVADVAHNDEPVHFKINITSDHSFESANSQHDFPKQISYTCTGKSLTATISGDGKEIPFQFKRVR